jgi:hypothetical protein
MKLAPNLNQMTLYKHKTTLPQNEYCCCCKNNLIDFTMIDLVAYYYICLEAVAFSHTLHTEIQNRRRRRTVVVVVRCVVVLLVAKKEKLR